ncbi:hypothetical protein V500_06807, partial [Pseudogymnoascus sp. VKM F-4518 (FW-2643)]
GRRAFGVRTRPGSPLPDPYLSPCQDPRGSPKTVHQVCGEWEESSFVAAIAWAKSTQSQKVGGYATIVVVYLVVAVLTAVAVPVTAWSSHRTVTVTATVMPPLTSSHLSAAVVGSVSIVALDCLP